MKQKIDFKDNVSETLLIPLWMRAIDPILDDGLSRSIVNKIDYDFEKFSIDKGSQQGVRIRTLYLKQVIETFIESHKRPVVIMLGCGLDPQSRRVENRNDATFYALDLPDVITLRRRFLPDADYEHYISASVFDTDWMERIAKKHNGASFLFVAEGLMMYFTEDENRALVCNLADRFPCAEIYFERMSNFAVRNQAKHKSISQVAAQVRWGVDSPKEVCQWIDGIKCIADYKYLLHAKGIFGILGRFVPPLANSCGIYGILLPNNANETQHDNI